MIAAGSWIYDKEGDAEMSDEQYAGDIDKIEIYK